MKILMIGGTRFFGKRFVQLMLEQGHTVSVLTRGQTIDQFGSRITRLVADRKDTTALRRVLTTDYDVVVDNILMSAQEAREVVDILKDRIGRFVMTSTLSVYDPKPGAIVEDDFIATKYVPKTPTHPGEEYQQGKRAAEHALSQAGIPVSVMRIPIIVGPDDYTQRLFLHVQATQNETKLYFPNPDARFSYLHAQDAARALCWLCTQKQVGTYNISAPDAWSLRQLMECISLSVGKDFKFGDSTEPPSPFGVPEDYFMNTEKAQAAGFQVPALAQWLLRLIDEIKVK
ncbi:MAG: NAD-dependent epimerase/dehydratase family protein [Proteobacteria bacterium]|jgi:nucleoside-diphosphate-sugar epimerase|nr:NAD-dependent epimerase/dehydratase family protein [Pseudomonadota bacterium]